MKSIVFVAMIPATAEMAIIRVNTKYSKIHVTIPRRDRNGSFNQHLIPDYARRTDDLETTIITLYGKGITTREISVLLEPLK